MELAGPQEDPLAVDVEGVAIVAHGVVVADLGGDPRRDVVGSDDETANGRVIDETHYGELE